MDSKIRMNRDEVMDLAELVKDEIGYRQAYTDLCKALSAQDLQECLEFICRMYDIKIPMYCRHCCYLDKMFLQGDDPIPETLYTCAWNSKEVEPGDSACSKFSTGPRDYKEQGADDD